MAPPARALLDRRSVGGRLGNGSPSVSSARRSGDDALGVIGPVLGASGRAWYVTRLRVWRRVSPGAGLQARRPRSRLGVRRGRRGVPDPPNRRGRCLGSGRDFTTYLALSG